jgi:hypothetical protein
MFDTTKEDLEDMLRDEYAIKRSRKTLTSEDFNRFSASVPFGLTRSLSTIH